MTAAYKLRFLNYTLKKAIKENIEVMAGLRKHMHFNTENGLKWFCHSLKKNKEECHIEKWFIIQQNIKILNINFCIGLKVGYIIMHLHILFILCEIGVTAKCIYSATEVLYNRLPFQSN